MTKEERWEQWLKTPFPCGCPNTRENTLECKRFGAPGGMVRGCRECNRRRLEGHNKPRKTGKDMEKLRRIEAALTANGRCERPGCGMWKPCGGHPPAAWYGHFSRPTTMPE